MWKTLCDSFPLLLAVRLPLIVGIRPLKLLAAFCLFSGHWLAFRLANSGGPISRTAYLSASATWFS